MILVIRISNTTIFNITICISVHVVLLLVGISLL